MPSELPSAAGGVAGDRLRLAGEILPDLVRFVRTPRDSLGWEQAFLTDSSGLERISAKNSRGQTHDPFSTSILSYEVKFFGVRKRYVVDSVRSGVM